MSAAGYPGTCDRHPPGSSRVRGGAWAWGCLFLGLFASGCGGGSSKATREADPQQFSLDRIVQARAMGPVPAAPAQEEPSSTPPRPGQLPSFRQWGLLETAVDALARIGADAVAPLIETLADRDPQVRANAARALSLMGAQAEPAVPALIDALEDEDEQVRANAARALGQIGPAARQAIPALIESLRKEAYRANSP